VLDSSDFGDRVRAGRVAASLSQEELSAQSGVSVRSICDLERGRTRWPHPASVQRLADALQLTGTARAEFVGAANRRLPSRPASAGAGQVALPAARRVAASGAGRIVPRQLPPTMPVFAGRSAELDTLSRVLSSPGGTAVITAIGGTAGVGKTALALHWGHLVAAEFPDGQLYVNLNGYGPSGAPVSPASAVRVLLEGLEVPAERMPLTTQGQLNLYRSLLAGKRMLVVLDNAHDEAQVRALLPGSLTCRVVVTSRNLLAGLAALDAAHPLRLDVLSEADAWDLLEQRLGAERLHADDGAVYQVIKASAYLPLALTIVAARAALRPDLAIADIAAELTADPGLDAFSVGEPAADIRAVLSWSYRQLDDETARVFRLAGLHPGAHLDRYAIAALTGMTLGQAEQMLLSLAEGGLVQQGGPGRYSMHDLLREYARELSAEQDSESARRNALTALFDCYLHAAYAASAVMYPADSQRPPRVPAPATPLPPFADPAQAEEWLDSELASLVAISGYAAANGWLVHATEMSAISYTYLHIGHHYTEAEAVHRQALEAAEIADDHSAAGTAMFGLADADFRQGRLQDAIERYQQALRRYQQADDRPGQIRARHHLSNTYQTVGQFGPAAAHLRLVLAFYRAVGDRVREVHVLDDLGLLYLRLGRYEQASRYLHRTLALCRETGDRRIEPNVMMRIAFADLRLGQLDQAADRCELALAIMRDRGDRRGESNALRYLGAVRMQQGEYERAASCMRQTLVMSAEFDCIAAQADTLGDLGLVRIRQGRPEEAIKNLQQALGLARRLEQSNLVAIILNGLGEAFIAAGRPVQSRERYTEALTIAAEVGDKYEMARAQAGVGSAQHALGDTAAAIRLWRLAYDGYVSLGVPEAEEIRSLIDS
jgi:tetratricopeptide (TPR) repeat protein/transcriptional regulator with XRE-family HTH domain